jgi:hypothetical protein
MYQLVWAARIIVIICLLASPLLAEDSMSNSGNTPPGFKLFASDPAASPQNKSWAFPVNSEPQSVPPVTITAQHGPLSGGEKLKYYLRITYGPVSVGSSLLLAGIKQAEPSVPEWGGGMGGYGKRFGSAFGQKAISHSIRIGLNGLLREDPRYVSSGRTGYLDRTVYAVGQTFWARKDAGGRRLAFSRFAGAFGAACIAKQWYPESYHTVGKCLTSGIVSLGVDTSKSIFYEFWPDLRRLLHH